MFPIAIIAGVIGAVVSTAEGTTWASQHLGSSKSSSVGSKTAATAQADAKAAPSFEATLAAQVTGQSVPTSTTPASASQANTLTATQQLTTYDTLARTQAGIAAYSKVAEHHNSDASSKSDASDVSPLIKS